ncbi:adenylyl-sulfate kinase [Candidatus Pelagibacter ubique]|jgi:adenylylsulfate kinase|nr:adenylyl-sulfate kinase [Candidatus Pelagibacter ubique]
MVIWIIGLSGSGKSYLSKKIYANVKGKKILVDGDIVRKYITYNLKYTKIDRERNSLIISDLCKFLEKQKFTVVCSILSIFKKHQKLNRTKFENYFQIYLKNNLINLKKRNNKNIYSKINVVGKKIKFPIPQKNDLIIENNFKPYNKNLINNVIKKINNAKKNKKNY